MAQRRYIVTVGRGDAISVLSKHSAFIKKCVANMNKPQLEIPVLNIPVHPDTMDGRDPTLLRGDAISGDRYYSAEFARAEWQHMWTKIWHVAGRLVELG